MIKAAVFDMDGTILNTIGDLTDSLNYALVETGHKGGHPEEMVKLCFGWAMRLDMIKAIAMAKGFSAENLELAGNTIPVEDIPATEEEINELNNLTNFIFAFLPTLLPFRVGIFLYSESHRFFCP